MAISKDEKYKEYARYAVHCLNTLTITKDKESRTIQRQMAAEWIGWPMSFGTAQGVDRCKWSKNAKPASQPVPAPCREIATRSILGRALINALAMSGFGEQLTSQIRAAWSNVPLSIDDRERFIQSPRRRPQAKFAER